MPSSLSLSSTNSIKRMKITFLLHIPVFREAKGLFQRQKSFQKKYPSKLGNIPSEIFSGSIVVLVCKVLKQEIQKLKQWVKR